MALYVESCGTIRCKTMRSWIGLGKLTMPPPPNFSRRPMATGNAPAQPEHEEGKNKAAVELGQLGGRRADQVELGSWERKSSRKRQGRQQRLDGRKKTSRRRPRRARSWLLREGRLWHRHLNWKLNLLHQLHKSLAQVILYYFSCPSTHKRVRRGMMNR